jgi:hypothetical protein
MKWKTNRYVPKENDTRIKRKFALFPVECEGGYTVWLETYDEHQIYRTRRRATKVGIFTMPGWDVIERRYLEVYI